VTITIMNALKLMIQMFFQAFITGVICLSTCGAGAAAERAVDLELVLAVDVSKSIDSEEAALQRNGYIRAFRHPEVIKAIRHGPLGRIAVTYVEYGGQHSQRTGVDWAEIANANSSVAFAKAIARSPAMQVEWTSISGAITYGAKSFVGNGFRGERRIIDISGDGPNNSGGNVNLARDGAVAQGIVINGLPIINDRPNKYGYPSMANLDLYFEDCVIGGTGSFIIVAHGFKNFARAIRRKLVTEIAGGISPSPLLHHASARSRPSCNAGEVQRENWLERRFWE
jgi:hypothetical protein